MTMAKRKLTGFPCNVCLADFIAVLMVVWWPGPECALHRAGDSLQFPVNKTQPTFLMQVQEATKRTKVQRGLSSDCDFIGLTFSHFRLPSSIQHMRSQLVIVCGWTFSQELPPPPHLLQLMKYLCSSVLHRGSFITVRKYIYGPNQRPLQERTSIRMCSACPTEWCVCVVNCKDRMNLRTGPLPKWG